MTLAEIRRRWEQLKAEHGTDAPLSEVVEGLLLLTEHYGRRELEISARLDHLTDLALARAATPDTLPHDWTDPT